MLLNGKRIFVVEDNLRNKTITRVILERQGAKIFFDRSGAKAVEHLRACAPIDLILLDLILPEQLSGFDIFEQIHHEHEFSQIPVVAVSAADAAIAIPKARALGFSGFIGKPIDFIFFPQQLQRILAGESLWVTSRPL